MSRALLSAPAIALFRQTQGDFFATDLARANTTCDVVRGGSRTPNGRFQYTATPQTIYAQVPCVVKPVTSRRAQSQALYADRLDGRLLELIQIASSYDVRMDDHIVVHGGTTFQVIAPPFLSGPQSPKIVIPCAAVTPLATNP